MSSTLSLSLDEELTAFVDSKSGDGTLYATPSEFVRDILRSRKFEQDVMLIRDKMFEGYSDAIAGRVVEYRGNLEMILANY